MKQPADQAPPRFGHPPSSARKPASPLTDTTTNDRNKLGATRTIHTDSPSSSPSVTTTFFATRPTPLPLPTQNTHIHNVQPLIQNTGRPPRRLAQLPRLGSSNGRCGASACEEAHGCLPRRVSLPHPPVPCASGIDRNTDMSDDNRLFGFLFGCVLSGGAVYSYLFQEYKTSNELLTEDIYVRSLPFPDPRCAVPGWVGVLPIRQPRSAGREADMLMRRLPQTLRQSVNSLTNYVQALEQKSKK